MLLAVYCKISYNYSPWLVLQVNEKGQLRLSRRALLPETSPDKSSSEETSDEGSTKKVMTGTKGNMEEKTVQAKDKAGTTKASSSNKSPSENTPLPQKKLIRKPVAPGKDRLDTNKEKSRKSGGKPVSSVAGKDEKSLVNKEANIG